ncbi:MAG: amidase, partial [Enterobacteriaceae bacterium]
DQLLAQGKSDGWMHGFPHAVKDLAQTQGLLTTWGSPIFKAHIPDTDAIIVERIKRAGAIIIGKTNTPEFGLGSHTYNPLFGATGNAWAPDKSAGGSSGGAAVALALKMLPVADGSDMMGSLRNPAAFNHVFGFRPSQGRVPSFPGVDHFFSQLGCEGPMGRTVADTAQLLMTLSGYDRRVPLSLGEPLRPFSAIDVLPPGLRIGWLGDLQGEIPVEASIMTLCEQALQTFTHLGAAVESAQLEFSEEMLWQTWLTLRHWQVSHHLRPLYEKTETCALLKPEAIWEIEGGIGLSGEQLFSAACQRSQLYNRFQQLFSHFDLLAMPSAQVFPFDIARHWPEEVAGRRMDTYHRYMEIVTPVTLAGLPALNIPVGFNPQGLPMGMQLIGPHGGDMTVLEVGHLYEQHYGWCHHQPPLLRAH